MKVLITGGAGFIGKHLALLLVANGHSVRILDNLSTQVHGAVPQDVGWLADDRIEFLRGSVMDRQAVDRALDGIECVVHLAAETGTGQSMYEITRYNEVNSQGTAIILELMANRKEGFIKRFILSSSRSVYGEGAYVCQHCRTSANTTGARFFPSARSASQLQSHRWDPICPRCGAFLTAVATSEEDPFRPASIYAATKYAQEDLVRITCDAQGIDFAILRLQNVYGEGQSLKNPYTGILSIFSTRIRRGLDLPIFEDGLESRDFVHVDDVARAMQACITSEKPISKVVNVGSGVGTSVREVAMQLITAFRGTSKLKITSEYRIGDIRHNFADISRLVEIMPDGPQVGLEQGLNRFAAWVLTQPLPEDMLDRANAELRQRKLMA